MSHLLFFSSPKDVLRRLLQDHLVEDHEVGTDIEGEHFASQIQHCDTDKTAMLTIHAPMIFSRLRKAVGISHRDFLNVSSFHMDKKPLDTYIYFFFQSCAPKDEAYFEFSSNSKGAKNFVCSHDQRLIFKIENQSTFLFSLRNVR